MSKQTKTIIRDLHITGEEADAIQQGPAVLRRRVRRVPSPYSHVYFHEPGRWWVFGDNSCRTFECPFGIVGDVVTLPTIDNRPDMQVRVVAVAVEPGDGRWDAVPEWVVTVEEMKEAPQ